VNNIVKKASHSEVRVLFETKAHSTADKRSAQDNVENNAARVASARLHVKTSLRL